MNDEVSIPLWAALTALGVLLGLVVLVLALWASARRDRADVAARLDALAAAGPSATPGPASPGPDLREPAPRPVAPAPDFVITHVGEQPEVAPEPAPVDAPLFADTLLRESVVRSAALVHGVRRALAPEVRHRIRFEVRQGTKRARRRRRDDLRTAHREWQARRRDGADEGVDAVDEGSAA